MKAGMRIAFSTLGCPSWSLDEVIKAADDAGIAMVFTGTRHFRH